METDVIYNEECLQGMADRISDNSIDMILADLPYGTTACKWDSIISLEPLWEQYKRITKDDTAIVLTASQPFTSKLVMSNPEMFKYCWVWEKNTSSNFLQVNYQPRKIHEDILVFSKGNASYAPNNNEMKYDPQMWGETPKDDQWQKADTALESWNDRMNDDYEVKSTNDTGKRYPESIIEFGSPKGTVHPTQKPVDLFKYLIKTYTNEGNIVLDNVIGSGTTAVAAKSLGRKYIGFEKNKEYYEITQKRVSEVQKELI